jgi:hypothetical protein
MFTLKYKLPLEVMLNRPIIKEGHKTYNVLMSELKFQDISSDDIKRIDGNYDWIDAWRNRDYDKKMGGFNNKDVIMEVVYDKGNYIITLVSDKSFDTIVKNNRYYSSDGPWEDVTLKEAIERFFEGCIYDGIGENEIGHIHYHGEELEVWMSDKLTEL